MEWTYAERPPQQSLFDFFADQINNEDDERSFELLALSQVIRNVCYGAYRFVNKVTGEQRISALIIPVQRERGQSRIGYRVLTEYEAPLEHHRCPERIYGMLTRFRHCEESGHAKEWRRRVEAWHARGVNVLPLKPGVKIAFNAPVQFDNGDAHSEFVLESTNPLLLRGHNDQLYRIANLRDRLARGEGKVRAA